MKITGLYIENFMALKSATLKLNDRGLVLVQGVNSDDSSADSNGAGKSSLPDALNWCFFGTTAREEKGDKVVNRHTKGGALVEVTLDDDGTTYKITRHRKHSKGKNSLLVFKHDGTEFMNISKATDKENQKLVEQIIGSTEEVFRAAIYAGQESMPDLPGMTDRHLKTLLEEASGITLLEDAYEIARGEYREAEGEFQALARAADLAKNNVDNARDELERTKLHRKEFEDGRAIRAKELKDKAAAIKDGLPDKIVGIKDKADIEKQLSEATDKINGVAGEQKRREELETDLRAAERAEAVATTAAKSHGEAVKKHQALVQGVADRVGSPCSECGKPYSDDDLATAKELAQERLTSEVAALRTVMGAKAKAEKDVLSAREALKNHVATMTDITELTRTQSDLNADLRVIQTLENEIENDKSEVRRLVGEIKAKMSEPNPHDKHIDDLQEKLDKATELLTVRAKQLKEQEDKVDLHKAAVEVYSPAGVRALILDTVTPYLNERTTHYLSILSDGNIQAVWSTLSMTAKKELREKFEIKVANDNGAETFKGLSGGEKRKVRLACALALQDLVASRATKPIDIWVGDEIDDALDSAGLERLMTILTEKARERGTVLVISHADLKDWIPQEITVTKRGKVSTVKDAA
jgi:DNA repair exonuclease SbcCD ATPase subunit